MNALDTEIKCTFSADQVAAAAASFGLRSDNADQREVRFFDRLGPAGPALFGLGVVLRLRRKPGGSGDSTLKLRPAVESRLTGPWLPGTKHKAQYRVEYDWARAPVLAAGVEANLPAERIDYGLATPKRAFTDEQEDFLRSCGPRLAEPFKGVRVTDPIAALRWTSLNSSELDGLRAEQWTWGAGRTFLELSVRVSGDAATVRAELHADLERRGLKVDDTATTKTETVLRELL